MSKTMQGKRSTILIIDDEKQTIELLMTHFRRRNYEPIATVNPKIVEQTLQTYQVHLIIVDLRMEGRSGYEILESLHKQNIKIPVLIMTAYLEEEKEQLAKLGVTEKDIIKKPFGDFKQAEALIGKVLDTVVMPEEVGSEYEDQIYDNNKTHLLLVDDETELNDMLKESFEARRYQVTVFTKGDEALEFIKKSDCHVAIIDMKIPGIDGHHLIKEARQIRPELKIIPISAAYANEMKELLSSVGFDPEKLVTKPFDLETLIEQVKVLATEAGTLGARATESKS
ncbi:MAG: response regulator [Chlamydiota bacterium]|nr:response regulator [Chlamydiota bacterium]